MIFFWYPNNLKSVTVFILTHFTYSTIKLEFGHYCFLHISHYIISLWYLNILQYIILYNILLERTDNKAKYQHILYYSMNNQVQQKIKEVRKYAKQNANLLGFDVQEYVEKALRQLGVNEL